MNENISKNHLAAIEAALILKEIAEIADTYDMQIALLTICKAFDLKNQDPALYEESEKISNDLYEKYLKLTNELYKILDNDLNLSITNRNYRLES